MRVGWLGRLSDREIERLLGGHAVAADDGLDDLAAHLRGVKAALLQAPAEAVTARHIAAAAEASRLCTGRRVVADPAPAAARRRPRAPALGLAAALLLARTPASTSPA